MEFVPMCKLDTVLVKHSLNNFIFSQRNLTKWKWDLSNMTKYNAFNLASFYSSQGLVRGTIYKIKNPVR